MNAASTMTTTATFPVGADSFIQPRRAAFWLLLGFVASGVYFTVHLFATNARVLPVNVGLGTLAWMLYTLPVLLLFRGLGLFEPQPRLGYVLAFAWGGFGAVFLALPANQAVLGLCAKLVSTDFCAAWGPAFAGPTDEEPLKLLGVVLLVLVARNQFRTMSSVLTAGALAGLGFQVVENLFYTVNTALNHSSPDQVEPVLQMFVVRGLVCGLWSHTAYTTVAAYGVGYFIVHRDRSLSRRLVVVFAAFAFAWAMHFLWNSPLITGLFRDSPLVIVALPAKGLPIFLAMLLLWRVARREQRELLVTVAAHYVPSDLITADEREELGSARLRGLRRRGIRRAHGRSAARILRRLQRAQVGLALRCSEVGCPPENAPETTRVRELRAQLARATRASD